jgi:hypothetical protein
MSAVVAGLIWLLASQGLTAGTAEDCSRLIDPGAVFPHSIEQIPQAMLHQPGLALIALGLWALAAFVYRSAALGLTQISSVELDPLKVYTRPEFSSASLDENALKTWTDETRVTLAIALVPAKLSLQKWEQATELRVVSRDALRKLLGTTPGEDTLWISKADYQKLKDSAHAQYQPLYSQADCLPQGMKNVLCTLKPTDALSEGIYVDDQTFGRWLDACPEAKVDLSPQMALLYSSSLGGQSAMEEKLTQQGYLVVNPGQPAMERGLAGDAMAKEWGLAALLLAVVCLALTGGRTAPTIRELGLAMAAAAVGCIVALCWMQAAMLLGFNVLVESQARYIPSLPWAIALIVLAPCMMEWSWSLHKRLAILRADG